MLKHFRLCICRIDQIDGFMNEIAFDAPFPFSIKTSKRNSVCNFYHYYRISCVVCAYFEFVTSGCNVNHPHAIGVIAVANLCIGGPS